MTDFKHLAEWLKLPDNTKLNIYRETGNALGLPEVAVEKDWWVVHTLALVFSMDCAPALVFKGGTSLSKGWNLIKRFSEDIDLAIDREYLKYKGDLSKGDIRRLRKSSYNYISKVFTPELQAKFETAGFNNVVVKYKEVDNHDQDPLIVEIYYPKLTEKDTYLKPGVLVEVGSRSLTEPFTNCSFSTMVADNYTGRPFVDSPLSIPIVNPEKTFLEKIFLLHEEFQRPDEKIRVERLSRHLYDIEQLSRTEYADKALNDNVLYNKLVEHRSKFSPFAGVNYDKQKPSDICFIPPEVLMALWKEDYKQMRENMIYGEALDFETLIEKLTSLQTQINNLKWV